MLVGGGSNHRELGVILVDDDHVIFRPQPIKEVSAVDVGFGGSERCTRIGSRYNVTVTPRRSSPRSRKPRRCPGLCRPVANAAGRNVEEAKIGLSSVPVRFWTGWDCRL